METAYQKVKVKHELECFQFTDLVMKERIENIFFKNILYYYVNF